MNAEIIESVRQLFVLFPAHVTTERIEGYASMLDDFEATDVAAACEAVVKIWTKTIPPPVGMVRDRATEARRERMSRISGRKLLPEGKPAWWDTYQSLLDAHRDRTGREPSMPQRGQYLSEAELSVVDV